MNQAALKIRELRAAGVIVSVRHMRGKTGLTTFELRALGQDPDQIPTKGGLTLVCIRFPGEWKFPNVTVAGVAICNDVDNFNRKIGLQMALARALKLAAVKGLIVND